MAKSWQGYSWTGSCVVRAAPLRRILSYRPTKVFQAMVEKALSLTARPKKGRGDATPPLLHVELVC